MNELPGDESKAALSTVKLKDGWMDPAQLYCLMKDYPNPISKACTFMASEGMFDLANSQPKTFILFLNYC